MGAFFTSWPLWQKMVFVLGCGIAVTMVAGFLKLWYNHTQIRKYSKVDKGKQAQTPEMLEAQPVTAVSLETKDEVPFGIRAIQSGIEVDGVWISRTNTPVGSSRASIMSDRPQGSYNNSQLELPQTAMHASSRNSSRAPSSSFDRAVSAERIPNESRSSSPGHGRSGAAPVRCGNCSHNIPQNSAALKALESPQSRGPSGPPSPRNDTFGRSGPTSNKSSRRTSDESDYMAIQQDVRSYESAFIRPSSIQVPVDPRTDLDLLQSHRMSHVAETGQLTPRVRKPGHSGEWASVADNQTASANGVSYFMPRKTPSPPLAPIADRPQELEASNFAQDSQASTETKQGVPLMESYAPKAAYYPDTYQPRGPQHQYSYDEVPYEVNTEQNQRDSQILRKVNPGFEILRPGTFAPPTPEEIESAEGRPSKKLQKKRRSSETRQSAFVEGV
jgi:hypothetical protein